MKDHLLFTADLLLAVVGFVLFAGFQLMALFDFVNEFPI